MHSLQLPQKETFADCCSTSEVKLLHCFSASSIKEYWFICCTVHQLL